MRKKRPKVFLVHGFETYSGRHSVHFGTNFNRKGSTRTFKRINDAKKFAFRKAKQFKLKKIIVDTPQYSGYVTITKRRK